MKRKFAILAVLVVMTATLSACRTPWGLWMDSWQESNRHEAEMNWIEEAFRRGILDDQIAFFQTLLRVGEIVVIGAGLAWLAWFLWNRYSKSQREHAETQRATALARRPHTWQHGWVIFSYEYDHKLGRWITWVIDELNPQVAVCFETNLTRGPKEGYGVTERLIGAKAQILVAQANRPAIETGYTRQQLAQPEKKHTWLDLLPSRVTS